MRHKYIVALLCALCSIYAHALNTNLFDNIHRTLAQLYPNVPAYCLKEHYLLSDFEIGISTTRGVPPPVLVPMIQIVSNNWREIFANLNDYATNRTERIIIENIGWFQTEDVYLECLSNLCDLVIEDEIPFEEMNNFEANAWHNHAVASALHRRYQEPSISNLLVRMQSVGYSTNICSTIFSGEACSNYLIEVEYNLLD